MSGLSRRAYRHRRVLAWVLIPLWLFLSLPPVAVDNPWSTVLLDREGRLLGARVASDGQWRFPPRDSLPEKYRLAVLAFEDRYFYLHPGFNPLAMARALNQNIRQGRITSGGSTLTMQLARLARKNQARSYLEKLLETLLAIRTELSLSKEAIFTRYAAAAPFGGNVVGLEAASWRYFGLPPDRLTWAEAATLAVLPNAPSLIYPGKNQLLLQKKRNRLLDRLLRLGLIDEETCTLSKAEPVPGPPHPLPELAPHLLQRASAAGWEGHRVQSTLDRATQNMANEVIQRYAAYFSANDINNAAALILKTTTGEVIAWVGNSPDPSGLHSGRVDIITSERSYGSLLKPFLYGAMLNEGLILPGMLVSDIPISLGGFTPNNFLQSFAGMVPANRVLSHSLNIPSVLLLQEYGVEKFHLVLRELGMTTLHQPASYYGLTLILGGAEGCLWELCSMYAALGHGLANPEHDSLWVHFLEQPGAGTYFPTRRFSPASAWFTLKAITETRRPGDDGTMRVFSPGQTIAWKTGTSFGSRDAWAIGVTPEYTVGIWIGNADGEGRPGLTGVGYAAPVLFDIFSKLPPCRWFREPIQEEKQATLCAKSGLLAGPDCPDPVVRRIPDIPFKPSPCPYHKRIHLDSTELYRVNSSCYPVSAMIEKQWFILPPVEEWFYARENRSYRPLPPWLSGCEGESGGTRSMGLIYPYPGTTIYLPRTGQAGLAPTIWRASHRNRTATIYWHLNDQLIGITSGNHQLVVNPPPGRHRITLVDQTGESLTGTIQVLEPK